MKNVLSKEVEAAAKVLAQALAVEPKSPKEIEDFSEHLAARIVGGTMSILATSKGIPKRELVMTNTRIAFFAQILGEMASGLASKSLDGSLEGLIKEFLEKQSSADVKTPSA